MSLRVGILTSVEMRHRYFVNAIAERFDVAAVAYQETGYSPARTDPGAMEPETARIVTNHFDERRRQEDIYFSHDGARREPSRNCAVLDLDAATLSDHSTIRFLEQCNIDVVAVYGTGLIKPPLLDRFGGRMLNMHLGLSPYYRGTATNFYPLLNNEPEFVGATIHMISAGIDSGDIIHHARPEISADDMPHTVGCKAIVAGIDKMIEALGELEAGALVTTPQWPVPDAKLYLRADYHPSQVRTLYELIAAGLFPNYVARKHEVQDTFRLIP